MTTSRAMPEWPRELSRQAVDVRPEPPARPLRAKPSRRTSATRQATTNMERSRRAGGSPPPQSGGSTCSEDHPGLDRHPPHRPRPSRFRAGSPPGLRQRRHHPPAFSVVDRARIGISPLVCLYCTGRSFPGVNLELVRDAGSTGNCSAANICQAGLRSGDWLALYNDGRRDCLIYLRPRRRMRTSGLVPARTWADPTRTPSWRGHQGPLEGSNRYPAA